MGLFDHHEEKFQEFNSIGEEHKAKLSHELLAGAASFYAARKYEEHVKKEGKPANHALAKELLAGFAGAFIDREIETKGLDFVDKEKAKHHAQQQINSEVHEDNY